VVARDIGNPVEVCVEDVPAGLDPSDEFVVLIAKFFHGSFRR
jgi:hypothetical protein